jgi:multidrug efflux pump subunit AcrA (membrane-fusion protein)
MKKISIIVTGLLLVLALPLAAACTQGSGGTDETVIQIADVTRGDLTVSVSGTGKVRAPREVGLTFGSAGRVASIEVEEGDAVNEGAIIANLDTAALELARSQAALKLDQAEVTAAQAEVTLENTQYAVEKTRRTLPALELAVLNAEISLKQAEYNLDVAQDTYRWPEIEVAQADVDDAEALVEYAQNGLDEASTSAEITRWNNLLIRAQAELDAAEDKLDAQMRGYDTEEVEIKKMQVQAAEETLAQARTDIEELEDEIANQERHVKSVEQSLAQAQKSVELAELPLRDIDRQIEDATL